jgi:hypothetical protein
MKKPCIDCCGTGLIYELSYHIPPKTSKIQLLFSKWFPRYFSCYQYPSQESFKRVRCPECFGLGYTELAACFELYSDCFYCPSVSHCRDKYLSIEQKQQKLLRNQT